jgi:hypothetical protein
MPKLAKKIQKAAEAAEVRDADYSLPLPAGRYIAQLEEVEVKEGEKGDYWQWAFKLVGEEGQGRKQWVYTSMADNAAWKLKEVFTAFGYSLDSDTDEMIGEKVLLTITVGTQQTGDNKGAKVNRVAKVLPLDDDSEDEDGNGADEDEKGF